MTADWMLMWAGQSAALVALTALGLRLLGGRTNAATRHAAWLIALVGCAGLLVWPVLGAAREPAAGPAAGLGTGSEGFAPIVLPLAASLLSAWLGWVWAIGAAIALALAARDIVSVIRLKQRVVPLTADERSRLGAWWTGASSSRGARVCWCDALDSPALLGFAQPVIAVPRQQASSLSDEQLQHVVLHELAHVRRRDDWSTLAEHLILALTWVNPAMHVARRQLAVSREMACDEWVVRQTASPAAYARCLAEVAGLRSRARQFPLVAAVMGRPSMLRRRIAGVLSFDRRPPARAVALLTWAAPLAVCVAAAGLRQLPPVFVLAPQEDPVHLAMGVTRPMEAAGPTSSDVPASGDATSRPSYRDRGPVPPVRPPSSRSPVSALRESSTSGGLRVETLQAVAAEQAPSFEPEPLVSSPLPGGDAPVVMAAGAVSETAAEKGAPRDGWWNGPAKLGGATGDAAASAGRVTASFFRRLGTRVPELLNRL